VGGLWFTVLDDGVWCIAYSLWHHDVVEVRTEIN